jgi:membrane protein YqaA with SNARE-associated domain
MDRPGETCYVPDHPATLSGPHPPKVTGVLRKTYDWTMAQAERPHAVWWLAGVSFVESSVFPVPPDVLLVPMVLARRDAAWRLALVCTLSSVLGGFLGYAIGALLFDAVAQPLLAFYGYGAQFAAFQDRYNDWGAWIVFGAGVTPFPYKVITIASGVTHLDIAVFAVASVLARGLRFFLVAGLLWKFGPPIRGALEAHLGKITALFFVLLLAGFLVVKWL